MNKRGFQLAINTLVIIVLALIVLLALALAFTGGFKRFIETIRGYSGSEVDNLSKICQNQCNIENKFSFCCEGRFLGKKSITCEDKRLNVECNIDCSKVCGIDVKNG